MNANLKILTAGVLFFTGQFLSAQQTESNSSSKEKEKDIEEVVVVGFGRKQAVKEITGATSTLGSKSLENIPVASVDKMLQGRVTGVQAGVASGQPGGFANIRVRGVTSINGGTTPIYVIDGVRISSGDLTANTTTANILANLNMDDVESLTVLKDATSTAIYGADAGAGVIVITTKSGKKGKPRFSLNFSHGFSDRAVEGHRGFTASEYKSYFNTAALNQLENLVQSQKDQEKKLEGLTTLEDREKVQKTINNLIESQENLKETLNNILNSTADTDWRKEAENKQAYTQNVDVSVSGGSDKISYYLSGNYFNQEGIVKNSGFKRLAFTSKIDYRATDRLTIATDIQTSYGKTNALPDGGKFTNPIMIQYFLKPTDAVRNADGSYNFGSGTLSNGIYNAIATQELNNMQAQTARIFANLKVNYKIIKNLNYRFVFAPEYINIEEEVYLSPLHGDGAKYDGLLTSGVRRFFNFNVQNILEYSFKLGKSNNFNFAAIQEAYKSQLKTLSGQASAVGSPSLRTLTNFVKMQSMSGGRTDNSRHGYAVTGHYDYDKLILVDLSYRRDVLSNFTPGKKAGNFWSAGVGVDLARLNFIKDSDVISLLKFRASYGKVGNKISSYPYATYSYNTNYNDYAALTYSGVYNPNLSWETVNPLNIGLDFRFFNDRLKITAEYYNKKTRDLVYNIPLDKSEGLSSYVDNIGSVVNRGFEFSVSGDIFKKGRDGFNWNIGANLSTLHNEVTELYGGSVLGTTTATIQGESLSSFYLKKWAGVDPSNGNPLWYKNGVDGETTSNYKEAKQAIQGSSLMKVYGGFNTTLSYKGIAFDAQFSYGFGGKIYNDMARYLLSDGYYNSSYPGYADQLDYWTPSNTGADNPKPIYDNGNNQSYNHSSRFLYKSDYIRLSSARLSYTFNKEKLGKTGLSSLQVYVVGNNIWTHKFDKRLKLDPEIALSGNSSAVALGLPIMKTYSLGVNIGF